MGGIELMLKSMGVDPEKIRQSLMEAQQTIVNSVSELHKKLDAIDAKLTRIETHLGTMPSDEAMKLLEEHAPTQAELESVYGRGNQDNYSN